jgi:hypothetical protein
MRGFIFILVLLTSGCSACGQQATPTPAPVELKLEKVTTITAVTTSLRRISSSDPKFEGKEDFFRIQLPQPLAAYKPAQWPKSAGEMPVPGRTIWDMEEAEIAVSITPLPPGLIRSWSRDELGRNLTDSIDSAIGYVTNGRKIDEKDINIGDISGREVKVISRGKILFARVFFANDRQYVLGAQLKEAPDAEALVKTAFDTFEIIASRNVGRN